MQILVQGPNPEENWAMAKLLRTLLSQQGFSATELIFELDPGGDPESALDRTKIDGLLRKLPVGVGVKSLAPPKERERFLWQGRVVVFSHVSSSHWYIVHEQEDGGVSRPHAVRPDELLACPRVVTL